jgi:hypothetical protein
VRQQRRLLPIFAIDEPTHRHPPEAPSFRILKQNHSTRNRLAHLNLVLFPHLWTPPWAQEKSSSVVSRVVGC